jgi:hypothetical protein
MLTGEPHLSGEPPASGGVDETQIEEQRFEVGAWPMPIRPTELPAPMDGRSPRSRHGTAPGHPGRAPAAPLEAALPGGFSTTGDDVHDTAHGVRSIHRGRRSSEDFDPFDLIEGDRQVEIEMAGLRITHPHTIHQNNHLFEPRSPNAQITLGGRSGHDLYPCGPFEDLGHRSRRKCTDLAVPDDLNAAGKDGELGAHSGAGLDQKRIQRNRALLGVEDRGGSAGTREAKDQNQRQTHPPHATQRSSHHPRTTPLA